MLKVWVVGAAGSDGQDRDSRAGGRPDITYIDIMINSSRSDSERLHSKRIRVAGPDLNPKRLGMYRTP